MYGAYFTDFDEVYGSDIWVKKEINIGKTFLYLSSKMLEPSIYEKTIVM